MRMSLMTLFQWLSIVTGFLAAGFWFWSARVRLPTTIISGWGGSGGTAQELGNKLHAQGHISAAAGFVLRALGAVPSDRSAARAAGMTAHKDISQRPFIGSATKEKLK
jgi:hypothetical protein